MILDLRELIDVAIMTIAVGYIFMGIFKFSQDKFKTGFDWKSFKFACLVTAPAIILHELGHKFAALAYGFEATFHAAYTWLGIGIVLRALQTGFIFFVPAYVSIGCATKECVVPPLQMSAIAAAGPFVNLAIFFVCWILLKRKDLKKHTRVAIYVTKQINLFLFVFNMLPIPMFDGFKVYSGLWKAFF
ncbi:M50 family metallopeptidase [Candidatus Woesearchaeota archaeon]|nr:M50 family metallopeptidase [Candidatus Woesearchaeota archaeon]MBW3005655.1 M50 family metallopeptidase [Candidatus Woesearchaeota archaeon]